MGDRAVTIGGQATYEIIDTGETAQDDHKALVTKDYVDNSLGMGGITASAAEINILDGAILTTAELNKLAGAGAVVASGTEQAHVADAKTDYGAGDLDVESEIIGAFNTTNGKINSILAALEAFGINASS